MDQQELRTLQLLEEIEGDQAPSQRDLATRLGISLGLVNSFIKRLAKKGYFKITTIPKNRVRYILTPKGTAGKTRLTYEYIQLSFQYYKNSRSKLTDLFKQYNKQKIRKVVFFGSGELAEIAYLSLQETDIRLVAVVDNQDSPKPFMQQKVLPIEALKGISFDRIIITNVDATWDAMKAIMGLGISRTKITLLAE